MTNRILGLVTALSLAACTTEDDVGEVSQNLLRCDPPKMDLTGFHTDLQSDFSPPCTAAIVEVEADTRGTDLDYWFTVTPDWDNPESFYVGPPCLESFHLTIEALTADGWEIVREHTAQAVMTAGGCILPSPYNAVLDPSDDQLDGIDRLYRVTVTAILDGAPTNVSIRAREI